MEYIVSSPGSIVKLCLLLNFMAILFVSECIYVNNYTMIIALHGVKKLSAHFSELVDLIAMHGASTFRTSFLYTVVLCICSYCI